MLIFLTDLKTLALPTTGGIAFIVFEVVIAMVNTTMTENGDLNGLLMKQIDTLKPLRPQLQEMTGRVCPEHKAKINGLCV